jgi:hypothetical protein
MKLIFKPFVWFFSLFKQKNTKTLFSESVSIENESFGKVILDEKNVHHEIYNDVIENSERPAIPNSELVVKPSKNKRGYNIADLKGLNIRIKVIIGNKEYKLTPKQLSIYKTVEVNPYSEKWEISVLYCKREGKRFRKNQANICNAPLKALIEKNLIRKTHDNRYVITVPKLGSKDNARISNHEITIK